MSDDLGDRMKVYERAEAGRKFMPLLPIIARVDGRSFSNFTRGMARPYDPIMADCMVETASELLAETNACCAYTQSDEITLAWHVTNPQSQVWFDGKGGGRRTAAPLCLLRPVSSASGRIRQREASRRVPAIAPPGLAAGQQACREDLDRTSYITIFGL